ncbi:MAG: hypothetical protein JWO60_2476 [Frankiales bacterium]|nr:hypothetical protein [Frankiales bacterium]
MPDPRLLQALLAWRQDQLDSGSREALLPLVDDLATIAATDGVNRALLDTLPLVRPDLVLQFAPGVLSTLRQTRKALEAAGPAPAPAPPPAPAPTPPAAAAPPPAAAAPPPAEPSSGRRSRGAPDPAPTADPGQGFFGWSSTDAPAAAAPEPVAPPAASRRQSRHRTEEPAQPAGPSLRPEGFASYDLAAAAPVDVGRPGATTTERGVRLSWESVDAPGQVMLYRAVCRDDFEVWSPDDADVVAVTTTPEAVDTRPFTAAVRFYAVWVNVGADEASARAAQPRLLAKGEVVAAPTRVRVEEDHGTVFVSWDAGGAVERVEVLRVPVEHAQASGYQRRFSVGEARGRTSFQDDGCEPGKEYEYRLFAVWTDPASELERTSAPAVARVRVGTVLTPVRRLDIAERVAGDRTVLDLAWDQPPRNEVVVYRTATPPATGASTTDLDVSALPAAGLAEEDRLKNRPHVEAGRATLTGVAWPQDWPRVHFTAVSLGGSTARIGDTATRSRTSRVEDIRIVERVDWQLLTFSWPSGAVSVSVLTTPTGMTLDEFPGEVVAELSEADYRRNGGTRLQLPAEGCDVHLVPKSFFERKQVTAPPETRTYPGLFSMWYLLQPPPAVVQDPSGGGRRGREVEPPAAPTGVREVYVRGVGHRPAEAQVTVSLVARSDRLPLAPSEREVLVAEQRMPLPGPEWQSLGVVDLGPYAGGYVRMFATAEGFEVALLDPDLASLRP